MKRSLLACIRLRDPVEDTFHFATRMPRNDAACLKYDREKTDITVSKVLDAYEDNGSFLVSAARTEGVSLQELREEDRLKALNEIRADISKLQTLQSNKIGGPSGILGPPCVVANHFNHEDGMAADANKRFYICAQA